MANFEYTGVTAGIRDAEWEAWLEDISSTTAGVIAGMAGLTDVLEDGDWDVTNDTEYNELLTQTRAFYKKVK